MAKTRRPAAATASGRSLNIGLNAVDPKHYDGWAGELGACEQDARDMAAIARSKKMKVVTLLTSQATRRKTLNAIRFAASKLRRGDFFFLTYSGHGGQVRDITGEEDDRRDETWCLFDGQLIDDELYFELSRFAAGVRILVLSDSCHSGTMTRGRASLAEAGPGSRRSKMMPPAVADATYAAHQGMYDALQKGLAKATAKRPAADPDSVLAALEVNPRSAAIVATFRPAAILISACQDNQTALDGDPNSAFTEALMAVWNGGAYTGNYVRFQADIVSRLPAAQTPNLFSLGPVSRFLRQQPLAV